MVSICSSLTDVLGMGTIVAGLAMNKKSYDELPPDLKKVVDAPEFARNKWAQAYDVENKRVEEVWRKRGIEFITLPDAEMKLVKEKAMPVWDKFVKDAEAKGLPGKAFIDDFKKALSGGAIN